MTTPPLPPDVPARPKKRDGGHERPQIFGKTLFVDLMMSTLIVVTALLMASNAIEKATARLS